MPTLNNNSITSKILPQNGTTAPVQFLSFAFHVRMAEWSKALRSGRSPLLWARVRIPLLTETFHSSLRVAHNLGETWTGHPQK